MPLDFAELQKRKRPATATRDIALDPAAVDAYNEALAARDEAVAHVTTSEGVGVAEARRRLAEATDALVATETALRDSLATFRFQALGADEYESLVDLHPPTPEQTATARREGNLLPKWNVDTFPQALVAACCVEPALDEAEVSQLWKSPDWNQSERLELFYGALEANSSRRVPDLGKGYGPIPS